MRTGLGLLLGSGKGPPGALVSCRSDEKCLVDDTEPNALRNYYETSVKMSYAVLQLRVPLSEKTRYCERHQTQTCAGNVKCKRTEVVLCHGQLG